MTDQFYRTPSWCHLHTSESEETQKRLQGEGENRGLTVRTEQTTGYLVDYNNGSERSRPLRGMDAESKKKKAEGTWMPVDTTTAAVMRASVGAEGREVCMVALVRAIRCV